MGTGLRRGGVAKRRGMKGVRAVAEGLEGRVMLAEGGAAIELFEAGAAVFVENQGQWADQTHILIARQT